MRDMIRQKLLFSLATLLFTLAAGFALAQDVEHVVSGEVTKVDKDAKTITIKATDGSEHALRYTEKTTVKGYRDADMDAKKGAADTYLRGKEGTHVVVRYTDKGADKVVNGVNDFGKDAMKETRGTVTKVDKASHDVVVKAEDGSETTYHLGRDAWVDTEKGAAKGANYTAKEGDKVVVHYTEDAGKKVVRFFKNL